MSLSKIHHRILITGGAGQLAQDCRDWLKTTYEVFCLDRSQLDITDCKNVAEILDAVKPDIVLNGAAFTKVDACESNRELAKKVNADAPQILARETERRNIKLIHISTDYIFDGKKGIPQGYSELDDPAPLSFYGKTKLMGEQAVINATDNYLLIRTAWLYGIHGHNFLKTILKRALQKQKLKIVNDQFGALTWAHRLSQQIHKIIETDAKGIYHASAEAYATWYQGAQYFLKKMEIPADLTPCSTEEYKTPALRPKNSILENARLKKEGLNIMRPWQEDIDEFVGRFRNRLIEEAQGSPP